MTKRDPEAEALVAELAEVDHYADRLRICTTALHAARQSAPPADRSSERRYEIRPDLHLGCSPGMPDHLHHTPADEATVERVAKAIYDKDGEGRLSWDEWEEYASERLKERYRAMAHAAIAALTERAGG